MYPACTSNPTSRPLFPCRSKKHLRRDEEQLGRDPLRGKSDSLSDAGDEEVRAGQMRSQGQGCGQASALCQQLKGAASPNLLPALHRPQMDLELGEEEREAALWRRRRFWVRGFWALWTLGFLLTAVLLAVEDQGKVGGMVYPAACPCCRLRLCAGTWGGGTGGPLGALPMHCVCYLIK